MSVNINESTDLNGSLLSEIKTQFITLQANDTSNNYKIISNDAEIKSMKSQNRVLASNQITVNKIVSFDWLQKYSYGNVITVHKDKEYFAYSLRNKDLGIVRIFHKSSNERALLKSVFSGHVVDLAFAHHDNVLLACLDEVANVQIFSIVLDSTPAIKTTLVLKIIQDPTNSIYNDTHRIIWCTYIPDQDNSDDEQPKNIIDDASKVFVVTNNKVADVYHLGLINETYNSQVLNRDQIDKGHLVINDNETTILTASFSPDGSAIATATNNGDVLFFKISFDFDLSIDEKIRFLQKWKPHGDRPITSLYFLDDHKNTQPDSQFWSFVLTGCDFNREIKVWCCAKWQCLQTIRFSNDINEPLPCLKAVIDLSSSYLLLSDINKKIFYVLNIKTGIPTDDPNQCTTFVDSINEYPLTYPAIDFSIIDVIKLTKNQQKLINNKHSSAGSSVNDNFDLMNTSSNGGSGSNKNLAIEENTYSDVIQVYCIQTKQLQEMHIFMNSDMNFPSINSPLKHMISSNGSIKCLSSSMSFNQDRLSDVLSDIEQDINNSRSNLLNNNTNNNFPAQTNSPFALQPVLMTPDAFSNSPRRINPLETNQKQQQLHQIDVLQSFLSGSSRTSSLTNVTSCVNAIQQPLTPQQPSQSPLNKPQQHLTLSNIELSHTKQQTNEISQQQQQQRHLSSSSSSSSSSTESDLSIDAADKEIEQISLPLIDYNSSTNDVNQQEIKRVEKTNSFLYINNNDTQKQDQDTSLLNKVELIDENTIKQQPDQELTTPWPNPPLVKSTQPTTSIVASSNENTNALLMEILTQLRQQQVDIDLIKKQQQNSFKSVDSSLQTLKQQHQSSTSSSSANLNEDSLNNLLNKTLVPRLEGLFKSELKSLVEPQLARCVEPFKEQIPKEIAEKLKQIELIIKDNIQKMFKSKTILDTISQSVTQSLQSTIINSYRETFQKLIIPSFEKSCQNMYTQINLTFKKGTDDYIQEFENFFSKLQTRKLNVDELQHIKETQLIMQQQLSKFNENLHSTFYSQLNQCLTNQIQQPFEQNLRNSNAILQDTIISSVKAIIKEELNVAMRDQQTYLPERLINVMRQTGTMTPSVYNQGGLMANGVLGFGSNTTLNVQQLNAQETQQQMMNHLHKGQLNQAFQTALCAADLSLLVSLCETVNSTQVFQPCVLQQPVILSLIQQLCQELNTNSELKVKYLEEALMNLDSSNVLTREHMPNVLNALQQKLQQFIQLHPTEKITKSMRLLLMCSQSLLR